MRLLPALLAVLALASPALAQTAAPLDTFLEQRVPDELAHDGTMLSRLGVTLDVELVGDTAIVSLVDAVTGRVAASTKTALPADRDAAVASVTEVAAGLATQLAGPLAQPPVSPVSPDADDARAREAAEYDYRQQAIGFGDQYDVVGTGSSAQLTSHWVAHRGDLAIPLRGADFYEAIGRDDLAATYRSRMHGVKVGFVVTGVAGLGMVVSIIGIGASMPTGDCFFDKACSDASDANMRAWSLAAGVSAVTMFTAGIISVHKAHHLDPVSETEAKQLAADYNRRVRAKLGLPQVTSVAPYVDTHGGGVALGGRF